MARFRYQHIKSSVEGKAPTAAQLKVAEIGVNDFAGDEKLFIKNSTGDVVDFPRGYSREYIDDNEMVIAEALNDLNSRKLDSSAYTEIWESGTGESSAVLKGSSGTASGDYSVAEGHQTSGTGIASHAEGGGTNAHGNQSHAEGIQTIANKDGAHAEGMLTQANGYHSHAEGGGSIANASNSHAEGSSTKALGDESHAEGMSTSATSYQAHAEGIMTIASGTASHAEGGSTKAIGVYSHAEGGSTVASGTEAHAEGERTIANGMAAHAEGYCTSANTNYSHAEGYGTIVNNNSEHASGEYNVSNTGSTRAERTLFSVGNGNNNSERHNAFEIRQNGDIYIINKDGDDVRLQDEIGNIDVDQVIDETTSASTNPVSTSAVYSAITENEFVWANAYVVMSGAISSHTENTEIHVTAADKEKLHTHSNKAYLDSITGNISTMAYEDKTSYSSATEVQTALSGKANTASTLAGYGITNAYTKSETSGATELSTAFDAIDDLVGSGFTSSSITDVIIENERIVSEALNDLNSRKLDASAYTPTDLANYYTKSETSGATEISNALNGLNTIITAHTADTSIHVTQALLDRIAYLENKVIYNGHEYVDLGLPSGTKWATMNVGASSETDYGNYYQYGKGAAQYAATSGDSNYSGTEDPLAASADTGAQVWGGSWHMPTRAQMEELTANTTYEWVTNYQDSGINGGLFTALNGNTIFFPAAGGWGDGSQVNVGDYGYYWGSSPNGSNSACYLYFGNGYKYVYNSYREYGYSVRPVVG